LIKLGSVEAVVAVVARAVVAVVARAAVDAADDAIDDGAGVFCLVFVLAKSVRDVFNFGPSPSVNIVPAAAGSDRGRFFDDGPPNSAVGSPLEVSATCEALPWLDAVDTVPEVF
jgi:hypothetical protein